MFFSFLSSKRCKKRKNNLQNMPGLYIMEQVHGWIPEWPKGTDCKSAGDAFEGSNPSPSTTYLPNIVREIFLSNTKSFHHMKKLWNISPYIPESFHLYAFFLNFEIISTPTISRTGNTRAAKIPVFRLS